MRPVFADPKVGLVFKRIFGSEAHKDLLIALLNDLLGLSGDRLILSIEYLPTEQVPVITERKLSIVDVKCTDARGTRYVVEMQVLKVEAFEKRLVFNMGKAYAGQLRSGDGYPQLNDVVAVAICNFLLWPEKTQKAYEVGMLSRWRMVDELSGAERLRQMKYVVLELPKYSGGAHPANMVDRWAYFFREAERLTQVPGELSAGAIGAALEVARTANFTAAEWEAYDEAKVAEQDARGVVSQAQQDGFALGRDEGLKEGLKQGLLAAISSVCDLLGLELSAEKQTQLAALSQEQLQAALLRLKQSRTW